MPESEKGGTYIGEMTDNEGTAWVWTCPPPPVSAMVDSGEDVPLPFSSEGEEWVEYLIWFCFGFGGLWIFGLPVYALLGIILDGYYCIKWFVGIEMVANPPNPTIDFFTFVLFPWRKQFVWTIAWWLGWSSILIPFWSTIFLPLLGLCVWLS